MTQSFGALPLRFRKQPIMLGGVRRGIAVSQTGIRDNPDRRQGRSLLSGADPVHVCSFGKLRRLCWCCLRPAAEDAHKAGRDLTEASLEDLMNIEVTTVSKKEQKLGQAAAAIFVITQEDIRRSGMMNMPDLLRMV